MSRRTISIDPLDYLLINGQIDFFEHLAGMRFRRLYYIVNGSPHLRSSFPYLYSRKIEPLSDKESKEYQEQYREIMKQLKTYKKLIQDTCVFNIVPKKYSAIKDAFRQLRVAFS